MRSLTMAGAALVLVVACARTLARDDASRGFSATGPVEASEPAGIHFGNSNGKPLPSSTAAAPRVTLNRTAAPRPVHPQPEESRAAATRLPLGAPQSGPPADGKRKPSWLDIQANQPISNVLTGLSIVLGAFLLLAWAVRKRMPKGSARLPDEIIEVLGRATIAAKQTLHLVRVGGKLIVVSVTAAGTETLTEITDPGEVARILAACQQHQAHSSATAFRQVFEQLGREPAHGFLDRGADRTRSGVGQSRAA